MANICIIPARGGSKRIPKKNIKDFLGKPIIAYSIEAALQSNLFDEIMVSTDDEAIAEIAKEYGANVPFMRSQKNADDFATTADVIIEVIKNFDANNIFFNNICILYPCAPLINQNHLKDSYNSFLVNNSDSLIPIVKFDYPIQRALKIRKDKISFLNKEFSVSRSQDLDIYYHDSGQFYWVKSNCIQNKKTILTDNTTYYHLNYLDCQDIDTDEDWAITELKFKIKNRNNE